MASAERMIAYVTGIAGFLGSNVARELLGRGWTVLGCDNLLTGDPENIPEGAVFFLDDIRSLATFPTSIDLVVHAAAIARAAWPNDDEIMDVNVSGTRRVIEATKEAGGRLVQCSSCVAAMPEANVYAKSKWLSEQDAINSGAVALRYSNIYGKGQSESGPEPNVLASWRRQVEDGAIRVDGDGSQTRDFIHVSDAARATVEAGLSNLGPGWFDICTGVQTPIIEVALEFTNRIAFAPRRNGDPDAIPQDPGPAEVEFGFRARVPLRQGLKEVLG